MLCSTEPQKLYQEKLKNHLQMHFLEMPFSLYPILFVKKAGRMSETEEILLSVELVNSYKIFIEDSGYDIYGVLFIGFNWTDPIEHHCRSSQAFCGVKSA